MKRFLLILSFLMGLFVFEANAQTYRYKTTHFAMKQLSNGRWTDWTDWQVSNMLVTIDWTNDVVKIFSPVPQVYYLTEFVREFTDDSGGKQYEFNFIDQDDDKGSMRLRMERNGSSQLYIEFANLMWVYVVRKIEQ